MHVLFVDDEPILLRGLARGVQAHQLPWRVSLAESGAEALEILTREPVDAIVTDMRMPGMDGSELLARTAELRPEVVRVVLSGQATRESVLRAVRPMHQYLAKPCEIGRLAAMLNRSVTLRDLLDSPRLRLLVGRLSTLPSPPAVFRELEEELANPDSTSRSVAAIIASDPALAAKILQVVNSAVLGLSRPVSDIARAVSLLGAQTVRSLVLALGVFREFEQCPTAGSEVADIAAHSLRVAEAAAHIADEIAQPQVNSAYTAGLLHQVGRLVLLSSSSSEYARALNDCRGDAGSLATAERAIFGTSHSTIGAYLCALWGLPQEVVEAVAWHREPDRTGRDVTTVAAVAAACLVVNRAACRSDEEIEFRILPWLRALGLEHRIEEWAAESPVVV